MDLNKHLANAADAVKRRNYPFAIKLYGQLLALQPDSGEARAGLRTALFKKAEAKKSSRAFAMIGGGVHLLTAAIARLAGKHGAAAKALERYLVLDPLSEGANVRLGDSLERAGHARSALAVFKAFAEQQPRCLEACRRAGALLYEAGQHDEALAMYEQALKIDPRDQDSLKARKNLAAEGALRRSGLETAEHSRELIKDKQAHTKLEKSARLQLSADEIAEELDELEAKLAEQPDDRKLLLRVATLREMDKDHDGALDLLERALQLDPSNAELGARVGDLRLRQQEKRVREAGERGDESAAANAQRALDEMRVAEYRRRVEHHPTDLALRMQLGAALLGTGALDEAIAELQQAVKDPRNKSDAHLALGRAFHRKGMADLALGQLEKALAAASSMGDARKAILYEMGSVACDKGDHDKALDCFSKILEQDIGFRDVAQRVEELKSAQR
jgi:tetratricopeptide (TPR) repeat protein